jgi:hypothetical protein
MTILGLWKGIKKLLYGQGFFPLSLSFFSYCWLPPVGLMLAYVFTEFVLLMAIYLGEYSTPFLQYVDVFFFLVLLYTTAFGTFVIMEINKSMTGAGYVPAFGSVPEASPASEHSNFTGSDQPSRFQESNYM